MLALRTRNQFDKDIKLARKRGKDLRKLQRIVDQLQQGQALDARYRNHRLKGEWADFWECHIEPDWLLIYYILGHELVLVRTGTHSDLFG